MFYALPKMAGMDEKTGLCQVYLWSKDKGHIALQADGGPYISFWPKEERKLPLDSVPSKHFESLDVEIKRYGPPDKTIYVSDMNVEKIRKWWEAFTAKGKKWDLVTQNCANIVYDALGEGNDRFKDRNEGFAVTPEAVAKLAEYDMINQKSKIRFASSCKPSSK